MILIAQIIPFGKLCCDGEGQKGATKKYETDYPTFDF